MTVRVEKLHKERDFARTLFIHVSGMHRALTEIKLAKETALRAVPIKAASFARKRIQAWARTMPGLAEHCKNVKLPTQAMIHEWIDYAEKKNLSEGSEQHLVV